MRLRFSIDWACRRHFSSPSRRSSLSNCCGTIGSAMHSSASGMNIPSRLCSLSWDSAVIEPLRMPQVGVTRAKQSSPAERLEWIRQAESQVPNAAPKLGWNDDLVAAAGSSPSAATRSASHSYTHPILVDCSDEQLEREIVRFSPAPGRGAGSRGTIFLLSQWRPRLARRQRGSSRRLRTGRDDSVGQQRTHGDALSLRRHDMVTENSLDRHGRLSAPRVAMRMAGFVRGVH